jgi:hypothetical protein
MLLGITALQVHAAPYHASTDGSMIWDEATGLVWARCSLGQKWDGSACTGEVSLYDADEALAAALRINEAAKLRGDDVNDWVVPTVRHLAQLRECSSGTVGSVDLNDNRGPVPRACNDRSEPPIIHQRAFPNTPVGNFWSTSEIASSGSVWYVDFDNGNVLRSGRFYSYAVRLVRSGQTSSAEAALKFPSKLAAMTAPDWALASKPRLMREAAEKRERDARVAEEAAKKAAAERKANQESQAAEAAKAAAWKKIVASGAQSMYLLAGKAQRSGSVAMNGFSFYSSELYEAIIEKFPSSEYAVKATDQLNAMERTERQASATRDAAAATERAAQAQRNADNNASNRASCFSSVNSCTANCRSSSMSYSAIQYCVSGCQRNCN